MVESTRLDKSTLKLEDLWLNSVGPTDVYSPYNDNVTKVILTI